MPERTLIAQLNDAHIWLATLTALWGGLVSYFHRVQQGMRHSWISIVMHMSMSGFAGLMCWLGCLQFEVPGPLTAICTGLAGHMGAEFIKIIEARFESKLYGNGDMMRGATDIDADAAQPGQNMGRRAGDRND